MRDTLIDWLTIPVFFIVLCVASALSLFQKKI